MSHKELRKRFLNFFEKQGHAVVPSSSLIPDDPSVLLTTAGMQQFKSYYENPEAAKQKYGTVNVASIQKSFRTSDIDEVGDESHLTFFEMLGNFSFGGYFSARGGPASGWKEKAIKYAYKFITKELGLKINYVSVFEGDADIPADTESEKIWQSVGITDIRRAGRNDNFWGPTGNEGPCGPTTEIYVRDTEIWNIVFNEYYCNPDKSLTKLKTPGVDTGMGLERLAMVSQNVPTIFETDLFKPILDSIPTGVEERQRRIIADHIRGIAFLISDGVIPANQGSGYILRRLIRRIQLYKVDIPKILDVVLREYQSFYPELNKEKIHSVYNEEYEKFSRTLTRGLKELEKLKKIDAKSAFDLYQSYGLPFEVIKDAGGEKVKELKRDDFEKEFEKHQEISRAGVVGIFKGGLADTKPKTIRLHTAHHLLLAALRKVLGPEVKQRGSNITSERLRMDFSYDKKITPEELKKVEDLVNHKIEEGLEVVRKEMPREEALKSGAEMEFGAKYGDTVSVYFIQDKEGDVFSKEFCGGPHVKNTSELGEFKVLKEEAVSAGVRRIRATIDPVRNSTTSVASD